MSLNDANNLGEIKISEETIEKAAGLAALECYGIVGMSSQKKIKDGVFDLFGKENVSKGIIVEQDEDGIHIEINIVVVYGVKISEVARSVQEKVHYDLSQMLGITIASVDVNVQDVQVKKDEK